VAVVAELVDELGPDQAVSADDDDLHVMPFGWGFGYAVVVPYSNW
jgi:hypothetical protein